MILRKNSTFKSFSDGSEQPKKADKKTSGAAQREEAKKLTYTLSISNHKNRISLL